MTDRTDRPFHDAPTEVLRVAHDLASTHAKQAARFNPQQDTPLPAVADLLRTELQHRTPAPRGSLTMTSSQTLPPPQGPEYTRCGCGHIEPEHRPDAGPCLVCDCAAYRPAAAPAVQAPATDRAAPTDWVNGHPQLEAIAAAVWERCGRSDSGMCVEDDPRNIAVAAYAAVLAELPAPVDRAAVPAAVPGQADGETAGEAPRCDVEFEGGGQCTKAAGHRTPQNQDPHTPPAAGAQQPKEARP